MTLSPLDASLYFKLLWSLQYFATQKLGLLPYISSVEEYAELPTKKKLKVRDTLWERPDLIEAYCQENPNRLAQEELEIIRRWQTLVKGDFFIFRHLKKGSIFISDKDQVYSVQGIMDPLENIMPTYALPQMVQAILLPFKGQIIYDGLLSGYNVSFGGGIKANLKYTYDIAKTKGLIITTLEPDYAAPVPTKMKAGLQSELEELATRVATLKGDTALQKAMLSLIRSGANLLLAEAHEPLESNEINVHIHKTRKDAIKLLKLIDILAED